VHGSLDLSHQYEVESASADWLTAPMALVGIKANCSLAESLSQVEMAVSTGLPSMLSEATAERPQKPCCWGTRSMYKVPAESSATNQPPPDRDYIVPGQGKSDDMTHVQDDAKGFVYDSSS